MTDRFFSEYPDSVIRDNGMLDGTMCWIVGRFSTSDGKYSYVEVDINGDGRDIRLYHAHEVKAI